MNVKPILGDWEIPRIEALQSLENRSFVELEIPGRAGSLFQDMNTRPVRIGIRGSLYGDETRDEFLETLREKFNAGEPVTFVADIITATEIQYVVIEILEMTENAVNPDQLDYFFILRQSPPPPPPPDALMDLDTDLLDEVGDFADMIGGALDALGSLPDLSDPTAPLESTLDGVKDAVGGLASITTDLENLFGEGD
jgi:hypothetical protein